MGTLVIGGDVEEVCGNWEVCSKPGARLPAEWHGEVAEFT
jgi:hypothetical protein